MIRLNKDILVPVDFREPSNAALESALSYASFIKGRVHLLHVIEAGDFLSSFLESREQVVHATLDALEKTNRLKDKYLRNAGVESVVKVDIGKPYKKILEYAKSIDPSLILLGDNDMVEGKVKVLGSTNTQIITYAPWPVITIKRPGNLIPHRIVLPLDLSHMTTAQICNAMVLAREYKSTVYLMSVVIGGVKKKDSRIYARLQEVQETFTRNGVKSEMKLFERTGDPVHKKVLQYAGEVNADLVLILTHQESNTHDNYIGSIAHHIINEATMPVMSLTFEAANTGLEKFLNTVLDPFNIFRARNEF